MGRNFGMEPKPVGPDRLSCFTLALIIALLVGAIIIGLGQAAAACPVQKANPTCADVVAFVGRKPLWLAERLAKRCRPDLTEAQLEWGRQCVEAARKNPR